MRLLISVLFILSLSYGIDFYGKIEPLDSFIIKSDVSGKVIFVKDAENKRVKMASIVKIDDYDDRINLKKLQNQLKILKTQLKINQNILKNTKILTEKKYHIYKTYKSLDSKSDLEKTNKLFDYLNTKNQLNNIQITIQNLKNQIISTKSNIDILKNKISKKDIKLNGYIYKIFVKKGDVVNFGSPIANVMDLTAAKIDIYVPIDKINQIKNKKIFIQGKPSNFKIKKIYKVADERYITSYKVELQGKTKQFSKIVKVEFK